MSWIYFSHRVSAFSYFKVNKDLAESIFRRVSAFSYVKVNKDLAESIFLWNLPTCYQHKGPTVNCS